MVRKFITSITSAAKQMKLDMVKRLGRNVPNLAFLFQHELVYLALSLVYLATMVWASECPKFNFFSPNPSFNVGYY
jgi:hypothetical protein